MSNKKAATAHENRRYILIHATASSQAISKTHSKQQTRRVGRVILCNPTSSHHRRRSDPRLLLFGWCDPNSSAIPLCLVLGRHPPPPLLLLLYPCSVLLARGSHSLRTIMTDQQVPCVCDGSKQANKATEAQRFLARDLPPHCAVRDRDTRARCAPVVRCDARASSRHFLKRPKVYGRRAPCEVGGKQPSPQGSTLPSAFDYFVFPLYPNAFILYKCCMEWRKWSCCCSLLSCC